MRLFLCEKPSQGKDIARVIGAVQRGNGCYSGPKITVTWCIGHLIEAVPPEAYDEQFKRWNLDHLPIVPTRWRVEVKPKTASQYKVVKHLLSKTTELIIATDADREGEMIARELIDLCQYKGPVQRLWLSALNDASIRKALDSLRSADDTLPLYYCALARSRADWLIGMNLSRLFTLLGRQAGHDGVLSVGRVQTPTLRLVVDRDREIAAFVPRPYWTIDVSLSANNLLFVAQWLPPPHSVDEKGRCLAQAIAQSALQRLQTQQGALVVSMETERKRENAPLPFDLSTLQEVCSSQFGLDVQKTLDIAQSLYETHKATTYPRSDSGYLPVNMHSEVPAVLDALLKTDPSIQTLISQLNPTQQSRAWNDEKVSAHHGIIPTLEPFNLNALAEDERMVYGLIRAYYLAQFLPAHEYDRTTAHFSCDGESLQALGKRIVDAGWRLVLGRQADIAEESVSRSQTLPPLTTDTTCTIKCSELKALQTQPPKAYTQGELIKAMKGVAKLVTDPRLKQKLKDTIGIGTEATRASIINGLLERGYLLKKGRTVRASETAFILIDAVPAAIADPGTTAIWEQALDMIETGQLTLDGFIAKQSAWITQLVHQYRGAQLKVPVSVGPACPICASTTSQRHGKNGAFWSCSRYPECKGTLAVEGATAKPRRRTKK